MQTKWILGALALAATLLAMTAACSSDDDKTATPSPSVCDQKKAVEQSVQDLANVDVVSSGTSGLTAAVDNVKTNLSALKNSVSAAAKPQVQALETAVDDAKTTLSGIEDESTLSAKVADIETAITGISTAATNVTTALKKDCP